MSKHVAGPNRKTSRSATEITYRAADAGPLGGPVGQPGDDPAVQPQLDALPPPANPAAVPTGRPRPTGSTVRQELTPAAARIPPVRRRCLPKLGR